MPVTSYGPLTLGDIDLGAGKAVQGMAALGSILDLLLNSPFGMLVQKSSTVAEMQGALNAAASLSVAMANPIDYVTSLESALNAVKATLAGVLAGNLAASLAPQVSANVTVVANASAKLAGMTGLIDMGQLAKVAGTTLMADLSAKLGAGGIFLYVGDGEPATDLGAQINSMMALIPGPPTARALVITLATVEPATQSALKTFFNVPI